LTVCQGIAECKAGDLFNVAISASGANLPTVIS
jgi:hypothetical protein